MRERIVKRFAKSKESNFYFLISSLHIRTLTLCLIQSGHAKIACLFSNKSDQTFSQLIAADRPSKTTIVLVLHRDYLLHPVRQAKSWMRLVYRNNTHTHLQMHEHTMALLSQTTPSCIAIIDSQTKPTDTTNATENSSRKSNPTKENLPNQWLNKFNLRIVWPEVSQLVACMKLTRGK